MVYYISTDVTKGRLHRNGCRTATQRIQCQHALSAYSLCLIKAKFHYAILVADRSEAGRRPVADLLPRASSLLAS